MKPPRDPQATAGGEDLDRGYDRLAADRGDSVPQGPLLYSIRARPSG